MQQRLLVFLILLLLHFNGRAQNISVPGYYNTVMNEPLQPLENYLLLAEDAAHNYSIQNIIDGKANFKPVAAYRDINIQSTWWCKVTVHASFDLNDFLFGLQRRNTTGFASGNEVVNVYIIHNNAIEQVYKAGVLEPASGRIINHPANLNLFPFSIKKDDTKTIVLQIQSLKNSTPLNLDFALQHKDFAAAISSRFVTDIVFYAGIMFILFLFGLAFSFITKESSFYWFTLVSLFFLLHSLLLHPDNLMAQWFFPDHPVFTFYVWPALTYMNAIFYWQFGRSFALIKKYFPRWDFFVRILIVITAGVFIINIVGLSWFPFLINGIKYFSDSLIFLASVVLSIRFATSKHTGSRLFGLAACWLFFFQLLGILWNTGVLPESFPNPWMISQIGTMVIIFFSLAYRFKQSAKEKAEAEQVIESDKIKNRFFANISHEFRTPLTLMLGPLKQLEENNTDTSIQKKYFGMMRRNGERLLQLINQLLDLSKLESGKMQLHIAKTDITGFLKIIAASFESLAEQKQINYHVHFPEENIIGFIDKDKIEKVLVNLLSNAFSFTASNGNISLHVSVGENRLRFSVQDNGAGIPKEQLDKIFDRFHQVAGTEGGTGIGLSLARELVQLHKGQISVSSECGKGSTFRVSIPVNKENYNSDEVNETVDAIPAGNNYILHEIKTGDELMMTGDDTATVLIVEDNADLQQFIRDTLSDCFKTVIAANGKTGLQKAKEIIPDIIISDVMMPVMDGIAMMQQLKQEISTSHIPVIMLTAKAGKESRLEGLQTGADDYLVKPFDADELIARCKNLIEQRKKLRGLFSKQIISITPNEIETGNPEQKFLLQVQKAIEDNLDNELFSVVDLANTVFMSRSQLHRKLKALTGEAPNELVRNFRLERALQLLQKNAGSVTEIAFLTGFSSPAYFSKCFSDKYGHSPADVKRKVI